MKRIERYFLPFLLILVALSSVVSALVILLAGEDETMFIIHTQMTNVACIAMILLIFAGIMLSAGKEEKR